MVKTHYDITVIGAGPAGMSAACEAARYGASVMLLDEQSNVGGMIYRGLTNQHIKDRTILGKDYYRGQNLIDTLASAQVDYVSGASVWQVSPEREIAFSKDGVSQTCTSDQIILATGAQERPFPIPGWTLPGVMTVGGAQILLKSNGLAQPDAVFIGTGPLMFLVINQYIEAGIPIRAILDTNPLGNTFDALSKLPAALLNLGALIKGRKWLSKIRATRIPFIKGVENLRLTGDQTIEVVEYQRRGSWQQIETSHVFLHQGIVPNTNLAMATGCDHLWSDQQLCWHTKIDNLTETSVPGIFVAGDGGSIEGAMAAEYKGRIAAYSALCGNKQISQLQRNKLVSSAQTLLSKELRIRPFLDVLFRPQQHFCIPQDNSTIVCRCEEVTAGKIRESINLGCVGPNQLKSFTRSGMGHCQGRFCNLTVCQMIAQTQGIPISEINPPSIRPPIKPLMLCELANLKSPNTK